MNLWRSWTSGAYICADCAQLDASRALLRIDHATETVDCEDGRENHRCSMKWSNFALENLSKSTMRADVNESVAQLDKWSKSVQTMQNSMHRVHSYGSTSAVANHRWCSHKLKASWRLGEGREGALWMLAFANCRKHGATFSTLNCAKSIRLGALQAPRHSGLVRHDDGTKHRERCVHRVRKREVQPRTRSERGG